MKVLASLMKKFNSFFSVNWVKTLYFNFKFLDKKVAWRLPIFIYNRSKFSGKGKIKIKSTKILPGMIKLGINYEWSCISSIGIKLRNNGLIIFYGSGLIGNGSSIDVHNSAQCHLGKNFGIAGNFSLYCHALIKIGNNLSCSWNVSISDTDHHQSCNPETRELYDMTKPVIIGDNVWLCKHCIISKGSYLPAWVTVASMAMTNKYYDIEKYSIIGGIPAKILSKKILRLSMVRVLQQPDTWNKTSGLRILNPLID